MGGATVPWNSLQKIDFASNGMYITWNGGLPLENSSLWLNALPEIKYHIFYYKLQTHNSFCV